MDRRNFLRISAASLAGLALEERLSFAARARKDRKGSSYNLVILGDTHYDTEPADVYHTGYSDPNPVREENHRKEFVRNGEMWRERCPRMLKRASCLVDDNTRAVLQAGDLIQGDTAGVDIHKKMLGDVMDYFKNAMGALPFVTVAGNHDLRGRSDAEATEAYETYMPGRMSQELGKEITKTTFSFMIGEDAFIVIDFMHLDDVEVEKLLKETEGARYTFILVHAPVFPFDSGRYYNWIYHGRNSDSETRNRFLRLFARRNAIVICGHSHTTELADWYCEEGRVTQLTVNSVWSKDSLGTYNVDASGAEEYGRLREKAAIKKGKPVPESESAWFDEYRSGLKRYSHSPAAGSYRMNISDEGVTVDFYAGDSSRASEKFILR